MTILVGPLLRARVRAAGSEPLVTYYEPAADVRVELSAVTFANWVDKTSNLLVDELLLEAGATVALELARTAPGHWMTSCWQLACWQVGLAVGLGRDQQADLVVTGPQPGEADLAYGVDVLACSLHPLGLGLPQQPPAGVLDFAVEVRAQPDVFAAAPVAATALAWIDDDRQLSQAELVIGLDSDPRRRLVRPAGPWATAADGILTALVSGGSSVVVAGDVGATELDHIAAAENVDG